MTPILADALTRPAPAAGLGSGARLDAIDHPPKQIETRGSAVFCFICLMSLIALTSLMKNSFLNPIFDAFERHRWLRMLEKPSILWLVFLAYLSFSLPVIVLHFLMGVTLMALFDMLFYLNSDMSWSFLYGILYSYFAIFALFWIYPYAFLTVRTNSWMTR